MSSYGTTRTEFRLLGVIWQAVTATLKSRRLRKATARAFAYRDGDDLFVSPVLGFAGSDRRWVGDLTLPFSTTAVAHMLELSTVALARTGPDSSAEGDRARRFDVDKPTAEIATQDHANFEVHFRTPRRRHSIDVGDVDPGQAHDLESACRLAEAWLRRAPRSRQELIDENRQDEARNSAQ